jgi:hypothetical protein
MLAVEIPPAERKEQFAALQLFSATKARDMLPYLLSVTSKADVQTIYEEEMQTYSRLFDENRVAMNAAMLATACHVIGQDILSEVLLDKLLDYLHTTFVDLQKRCMMHNDPKPLFYKDLKTLATTLTPAGGLGETVPLLKAIGARSSPSRSKTTCGCLCPWLSPTWKAPRSTKQ